MVPVLSQRLAIACAATLLALLALAQPAAAQDEAQASPSDETAAREAFEEGRAHALAERWPAAVTAFQRSASLLERPSTLFNLASALVRVGRSLEVLKVLTRLEAIADPRRDRALLEGVAPLRETAAASLRHVVVVVTPGAARLEVDGQAAAGQGPRWELTLDPGPHSITATLDAFETAHAELPIGRDAAELTLTPRPARLRVTPRLSSAEVLIDGRLIAQGEIEQEVTPGVHQVQVRAEGYETLTREIIVEPGAELAVAADLVAIPPPVDLGVDVPLAVGLTAGAAALVALAVVLGVVLGSTTDAPSGGSTNTVIAVPLTSPMVRF